MPTTVFAGIPARSATLYHRVQFLTPDALVYFEHEDGSNMLLVRDIEMGRARQLEYIDRVCCPAEFCPDGSPFGRDAGLAQAAASYLTERGDKEVVIGGSLPFLYAHYLQQAGLVLKFQQDLGEMRRRIKTEQEIEWLRHAQKITGEAVEFACRMIAGASADAKGVLQHGGAALTSERVRMMITGFLNERNFSNSHGSIVVTLPHVSDCHHFGEGDLRVDDPVIVDIFPMDNATRYNGDMTRTVVNGQASDEFLRMHAAVKAAKRGGCEALAVGTTGKQVHAATIAVLEQHGYSEKRGADVVDPSIPQMRHGTGHGIGLEVHEPILLSHGGGEIHASEIFTVEPGLYSTLHGGVRIEDMVLVTDSGYEILSPLYEGWDWKH